MSAAKKSKQPSPAGRATCVLSAGAPNSPLMAGALAAIYQNGKTFDVFYTSGAGGLIGLVYCCPKGGDSYKAMYNLLSLSIDDVLWNLFYLPFKTFWKRGPFMRPVYDLFQHFKLPGDALAPQNTFLRLWNDSVDAWASILAPTTVTPFSKALCQPFPYLDQFVDFDEFQSFKGDFFLNAWNITDEQMDIFTKEDLDARHFAAAGAFPFMYEAVEIDGKSYYEGADYDPINLPTLHEKVVTGDIDTNFICLMDVMSSMEKGLIRLPRNLMDAYGISVMVPGVSLARKGIEHFEDHILPKGPGNITFEKLTYDIPSTYWPYVADWSYSNMMTLWGVGLKAGERFLNEYGDMLPDRVPDGPSPAGV